MKDFTIKILCLLLINVLPGFTKPVNAQFRMQQSYEFSLTNLLFQDLTFIYSHRIDDDDFLEVTNSFVFRKTKEYDLASPIQIGKDPYQLYNIYRLRVGIRHFRKDNKYLTPILALSYGGYNNGVLENYLDDVGDAYDVDYVLNRRRYEWGAILKFGKIKTYEDRYIRDIYWGVGFKFKYFDDTILQKLEWGTPMNGNYPLHENRMEIWPTLHFGIAVGYVK